MVPAPETPMPLGNTMIFDDSGALVWNPVAGELLFSVNQLNHIRRWRPGVPNAMNFDIVRRGGQGVFGMQGLALAPDGALIVCETITHRVTRSLPGYDMPATLVDTWPGGAGTPASRFNTPLFVVARRDGNIYFTDPLPGPGAAALTGLFRIDPAGKLSLAVSDLSHPWGITLSSDHGTLFVSSGNSYLGRAPGIFKFPINPDGSLGPRTLFVTGAVAGYGGGLCMDQAGNLYQANGSVRIFGPDGTRLNVMVPAPGANACAFGESDLKSLFVTAGGSPAVYNLWRVRTNIPGAL
jgi:gluconolactonase